MAHDLWKSGAMILTEIKPAFPPHHLPLGLKNILHDNSIIRPEMCYHPHAMSCLFGMFVISPNVHIYRHIFSCQVKKKNKKKCSPHHVHYFLSTSGNRIEVSIY